MSNATLPTISPADPAFYSGHTTEALLDIVTRYDMQAAAMVDTAPDLALEALKISNAAWVELYLRDPLDSAALGILEPEPHVPTITPAEEPAADLAPIRYARRPGYSPTTGLYQGLTADDMEDDPFA